jgi:tetratricopeptide (TPR) repeat protein
MRRLRRIELPLVLLIALSCVAGENRFVGPAVAARRMRTTLEQELAFYPSGRMLRQVTAGFSNVTADFLWLRAIQYYGEHRKTDLVFDKAAHVFRVLTDLDPHFVEAYRFGALVVIEDAGDPDAGFEILRKGIRENAGSWELAFDLGFHHFLRGEYGRAASYFRRASSLRPENERVARFAAYAEKKSGGLDSSEEMWREILESTENERFREAAEAALRGIQAARDTTALARFARDYRQRFGAFPRRPEDLVRAGILAAVPSEPYGERYVIHPGTGEVQSSYLLAREILQNQRVLQRLVEAFRLEHGRVPANLEELVVAGLASEIPSPWGVHFTLDAATDSVRASVAAPVRGAPPAATGRAAS